MGVLSKGEFEMVDLELTKYLAELSKIEFTEEELENMTKDMIDIINLMDKVQEIDPNGETYALDAVSYDDLRNDTIKESFKTEKVLKNAKAVKEDSFVVPKVV